MFDLSTVFDHVSRLNITCTDAPKCLAMVEGKCLWFAKNKDKKRKESKSAPEQKGRKN
jgi:hypothetical protein